jgi:hypothetical protein
MNGFENIKKRVGLREKFKNETGDNWENSQGEPDIDYVLWLESKLFAIPDVVGQSEQLVCDECGYPIFYHKPDSKMHCHGCSNTKAN